MKPSTIWAPRILSVLRIVAGLVLLQYGLAKLVGFPAVKMFENLPWLSLFGIAGMFELVGGTLLILGLLLSAPSSESSAPAATEKPAATTPSPAPAPAPKK